MEEPLCWTSGPIAAPCFFDVAEISVMPCRGEFQIRGETQGCGGFTWLISVDDWTAADTCDTWGADVVRKLDALILHLTGYTRLEFVKLALGDKS